MRSRAGDALSTAVHRVTTISGEVSPDRFRHSAQSCPLRAGAAAPGASAQTLTSAASKPRPRGGARGGGAAGRKPKTTDGRKGGEGAGFFPQGARANFPGLKTKGRGGPTAGRPRPFSVGGAPNLPD